MARVHVPAPKDAQDALQQARVNERAASLFTTGGYTWERETAPQAGPFYRVHSPENRAYIIDPLLGFKCSCPFYQDHHYCKHSLAVGDIDEELQLQFTYEQLGGDENPELQGG